MKSKLVLDFHPVNNNPLAKIVIVRDRKIRKNEPMPPLEKDRLYDTRTLPPQNQQNIEIEIQGGVDKYDSLKIQVKPSYCLNGPYGQYLDGVKRSWSRGFVDKDERFDDLMRECTRALTGVHKLATKKDLSIIKPFILKALSKLDRNFKKG